MKNSKIHNGLPEKDLRDFFQVSLLKALESERLNNKKTITSKWDKENPFDWAIMDAEANIEYYYNLLEICKTKKAIFTLIKMKGWQEFDVSDETERDMIYFHSGSFIGTEKEYKALLKTIKDE